MHRKRWQGRLSTLVLQMPTYATKAGLCGQAGRGLFDDRVNHAFAVDKGTDFKHVTVIRLCFYFNDMQAPDGKGAQDQAAGFGFLCGSAGHIDAEAAHDWHTGIGFAFQEFHQRAQAEVDEHHQSSEQDGKGERAGPADQAHGGGAPQGGGGVQSVHVEAIAKDDARAKKANAGDDLGGHAGLADLVRIEGGEGDEAGSAQGDQCIGAKARHALAHLAFRSDDSAAHKGGRQVQGGYIN
jgi:hypothetical protein